MNKNFLNKCKKYYERYGVTGLCTKILEKACTKDDYSVTREKFVLTEDERKKQENTVWEEMPLISIVVPAYNPVRKYFTELLESVKKQTYQNWELCITDAGNKSVWPCISRVFDGDLRVKYKKLEVNGGISENTNAAIEMASGDYISFIDHDDILEPDALYCVAKRIVKNHSDMIYTDEDKVDEGLTKYFDYYRKPDFNRVLLMTNNYICHFCTIRKSVILNCGGLRKEYDGAQDYDLVLRASDYCKRIDHIARPLYHWRTIASSTANNPFSKEYAYLAGKKAIEDYLCSHHSEDDFTVEEQKDMGFFSVKCNRTGEYSCEILEPGDDFEDNLSDYYLILPKDAVIKPADIDSLVAFLEFTGADIAVPKIVSGGKYLYNGIAKAGRGHTLSLKGKPWWFSGKFNLGNLAMEVITVPKCGILVNNTALKAVLADENKYFSGMNSEIKMVYYPDVVIKI